jgi:hypothetical protein
MLSEINTTPLVDVMLVLLIIFLITVPVINAAVAVTCPVKPTNCARLCRETVIVSVDANGSNYWFDAKLASNDLLQERLARVARQQAATGGAHSCRCPLGLRCRGPSGLCLPGGRHCAYRLSDRASCFTLSALHHGHRFF